MLQLLQTQNRRAFGEHETGPAAIKRAAGPLRFLLLLAQSIEHVDVPDIGFIAQRLGTASQHHAGAPLPNRLIRVAYRDGARGASRDYRILVAAQIPHQRASSGGDAGHGNQAAQRTAESGIAISVADIVSFIEPPPPRADDDATFMRRIMFRNSLRATESHIDRFPGRHNRIFGECRQGAGNGLGDASIARFILIQK
ncbi:Uncharacterised protein [Chromobacterium violaceum]|uniref:Uncharacterized protein n=1 Tax=Chromobacterium violaceum TaxID=536 RepID=A0A447TA64_CHRVL|nr:Uncharacterised protein [Chromobacterium violaceum]